MDDEVENLDIIKASIFKRVRQPLIWARLSSGYYIQDLQPKRFNLANNLLEDYFFRDEVLCKSSYILKDKASTNGYLERFRYYMGGQVSLECYYDMAKEEDSLDVTLPAVRGKKNEPKPVGVLICKICSLLNHSRTYSRIMLNTSGSALDKIMDMLWHVHREADIFERYDIDQYLRIYALCVHPRHRCQGIGMGLLNCSIRLAQLLKIPYLGGIFTDGRSQHLASKLGMETVFETQYSQWIDESGENLIFDDPGANNYTAAMMILPINTEIEEEEIVHENIYIENELPKIYTWYLPYEEEEEQ